MPQFIDNIKNQSAEALSVWFLAQWFGGDTLNLLGCLIQGQQLPTTTFLAMYFVLSDVVMLVQFIYYSAVQKRKEAAKRLRRSMRKAGSMSSGLPSPSRHHRHHHHHPLGNSSGQGSQAVLPGLGSFISTDNGMLSLPGGMEGTVSQNSSGALVVVASQGNTAHGSDAEQQEVAVTLASAPGTLRLRSAQGAAGTSVATALFAVASSASSLAAHYAAYTHGRTSHGATGALGALHATPQHALSAAAGSSASSSSLGNYKLLGSGSEAGPSSSAHSSSFYVQGQKCSFVNCDVALVAGTAMG